MLVAHLLLTFVAGASAADQWYSIWPKNIGDKDKNQKITDDLKTEIGEDKFHVSKSGVGNHYWYALLSNDKKKHYDGFDGVRYVASPELDAASVFSPVSRRKPLQKRDPLESQKPAPDHLRLVTQAEGQAFEDVYGYSYDKSAGEGITIYVIDSGLYKHPEEFPSTKINWLYAGPFADEKEDDADPIANHGHGTCMASVALGKKDGVAKKAALTVVKADVFTNSEKVPDAGALAAERWIDALGMVYDDINKNNLKGKAVVSMSWGIDERVDKTSLQNTGIPFPPDNEPYTYPAMLGKDDVKDLTVVSAVDVNGDYTPDTKFTDYTIAMLGDKDDCANSEGNGYHLEDGTSPATAAVAGLFACFMAQGKSASDARKQVFDLAYSRGSNKPKVVWNGIDTRKTGSDEGTEGEKDENKCHGVGGQTWVLSRDKVVEAAKDFCAQEDSKKEYYQGSPNNLELGLFNKDDKKPISEAPNCADVFTRTVIDGCDGNDEVNNPHNYKFGGIFTGADGWEYIFTPKAHQETENSCDVSYDFLYDSFEIRGKNFPDAKLGGNGEGLKEEVEGCGALNKWKFEWTPNDVKYQWYASGRLPMGTKGCVGRATQSAGGSSSGNCHGAG